MRKEASGSGEARQAVREGGEFTEEMDKGGSGWWRCWLHSWTSSYFFILLKKNLILYSILTSTILRPSGDLQYMNTLPFHCSSPPRRPFSFLTQLKSHSQLSCTHALFSALTLLYWFGKTTTLSNSDFLPTLYLHPSFEKHGWIKHMTTLTGIT